MNAQQQVFLDQAKSAYAVFTLLKGREELHHCHALHYLQMATELLAKASAWKKVQTEPTHKALVHFFRKLESDKRAQSQLGFAEQNENWRYTLLKLSPLADDLQKMAPALAGQGPNPEYPWPKGMPTTAPVGYSFPIWEDLTNKSWGRQLLRLLQHLFAEADALRSALSNAESR